MRHGFSEAYSSEEFLQVSSLFCSARSIPKADSVREPAGAGEELLPLLDRYSTRAGWTTETSLFRSCRQQDRLAESRSNSYSFCRPRRLSPNRLRPTRCHQDRSLRKTRMLGRPLRSRKGQSNGTNRKEPSTTV